MKKVCAITTVTLTLDAFVVEPMRLLQGQGVDVTLASTMTEDFINRNKDFKCVNIPMKRGIDPIGLIKSIYAFYKFFKKEKFDVIQYSTPNASLYASIAGRLARVPVRMYCQWGIRYVGLEGLSRKIFKFLEKITIKNSTTVRPVSFKNRQFGIDEGLYKPEKAKVWGIGGTIGVDLNDYLLENKGSFCKEIREKYNIPTDAMVFGFVGRLNRDKGITELLTAFKEIEKDNVYLALVGGWDLGNPVSQDLREYAERSDKIVLCGSVPFEDVPKHLAAFDILVHPTYREGFGKVIQEAMAMETAVITTDIPGPSEVIENEISGILVPVKNAEALAKEMLALSEDQERRTLYAKEGRKRAEKYFARPIMLNNILEDYKEILGICEVEKREAYAANR